MNMLLRHPDVYAKLKDEIRHAFKSEDDITLEAAHNLPYLSACIEENLRYFPPAPIGFLREIQQGGDTIDGHYVPGGVSYLDSSCENGWTDSNSQTAVSVSSWCAHHNALNFKLASRPFSLGPRGCIGKEYVCPLLDPTIIPSASVNLTGSLVFRILKCVLCSAG
jgi:Cytochrome P450